MGIFLPLYSICVEHSYFSDGLCRGLDFVPEHRAEVLMEKMGLLTRPTINGIEVFYDEERVEALKLFADDSEEPLNFRYKVYSRDPLFINYTAPCIWREDDILCLTSDGAKEGEDGRCRLHEDEYVSELDFKNMHSPEMAGLIGKKEKLIRPAFTMDIAFSGEDVALFGGALRAIQKKCYVSFKAGRSYWKYYLVGDMKKREPCITDVDNLNEFEYTGTETLPGNRCASVFRSKAAILLQERSACSFQLKEGSKGGGKILIKRLPVASADRFGREVIAGKEVLVSEIYINN